MHLAPIICFGISDVLKVYPRKSEVLINIFLLKNTCYEKYTIHSCVSFFMIRDCYRVAFLFVIHTLRGGHLCVLDLPRVTFR